MNGFSTVDTLDSADYDPIVHLNEIFTHPSTLSSLPATSQLLHSHVGVLDAQINDLVALQSVANATSLQRMAIVKAGLQELFDRIEGVRGRAIATEDAITAMTADIKRLDATKRNLTLSMTALKRLQMLTTAYEQLKVQCKSRQYRDCAHLLQAVIQLMAHFKSYRSIDQIATLSRNVADLQNQLLEQVCEDFEIVFAKGEVMSRKGMLGEACLVMDALGDAARTRLINWFCNTQLREYRQVFRGTDEAGSLDNIGRRYAWLKRILNAYDEEYASVFPSTWKVSEVLVRSFCDGTREDFKGILSRAMRNDGGKTLDVNLLLTCLQETLDFEQYLEKRFSSDNRMSIDTVNSREEKPLIFGKAISEAFEPYLSLWVDSQDRALSTVIASYRLRPVRPDDEEFTPSTVLASSIELFQFYKATLAQCAKLSTGSKLKDLSQIYAKNLDNFAEQVLMNYIPERPNVPLPAVETIIITLNTADYCHTLCSQLEEKIVAKIDEVYKTRVTFEKEQDKFMGVANAAIKVLTRRAEIAIEPCWREMRNTPWSKLENVGDHSTYIDELLRIVKDQASETLKRITKDQYKRAFCDRLVDNLSNAFLSNLASCKPISDIGAEQMLLDLYVVRKGLEELMTLNAEPGTVPSTGFAKHVNRAISKIDTILKVIQVQSTPPEGLVQAYLIHIGDKSDTNFRKIMDLKGLKKQEQASLMEIFHAHMHKHENLVDASPLVAGLNMDLKNIGASLTPHGGGPLNLGHISTPSLSGRFDPSGFGSALISGVREGVDRLGTPGLSNVNTAASSPGASSLAVNATNNSVETPGPATNLNENLKSFGRFFRRDTSRLGG